MRDFVLDNDEKSVLRFLYENPSGDIEKFNALPPYRVSAASKSLKVKGLINAHFEEGGKAVAAIITDTGRSYMDLNPNLEDPVNVEIEKLQKENLILQNNDLKYKATIRQQERVIRFWQVSNAVVGLLALLGWLLGFMQLL